MASEKPDSLILQALNHRVAFAFDFDETLAPNTTNALLEHMGQDPSTFRAEQVDPLVDDGWEQRLAEAHALIQLSDRLRADGGDGITGETFAAVARALPLYDGVEEMFDAVVSAVHEVADDIEVEFHLITAGFVNVPGETVIADRFDQLIGGRWAFADHGAICFPKKHRRPLRQGPSSEGAGQGSAVDRVGPGPRRRRPRPGRGLACALSQGWESRGDMRDGRQVMALAKSDFSTDSKLLNALCAAGRQAAWRIRLLELGHSG